jgi:aminoglycoside phosphotransferase (APT) family kinase protein
MENSIEIHIEMVRKIVVKVFGTEPQKVIKMKVGLDNEVFQVEVKNESYIVRLNSRNSIKGSSKFIPLFASLGIKVPRMIAEDYTKEFIPFNYQILEKLEGTDIGNVVSTLTEEQLDGIAENLVKIIRKLKVLPTNGSFGYVGIEEKEEKLQPTQLDFINGMLQMVKDRNAKTGVVKKEYIEFFEELIADNSEYFKNVVSEFYYDDMSSKNVIIHNGQFNGLVDLDGVSYGDCLEAVGRIKACWPGTSYGNYYSETFMKKLDLTEEQRRIVTMYAFFNRIFWLSEIGVQFNSNTSTEIDQDKVEENNKVVDALVKEVQSNIL